MKFYSTHLCSVDYHNIENHSFTKSKSHSLTILEFLLAFPNFSAPARSAFRTPASDDFEVREFTDALLFVEPRFDFAAAELPLFAPDPPLFRSPAPHKEERFIEGLAFAFAGLAFAFGGLAFAFAGLDIRLVKFSNVQSFYILRNHSESEKTEGNNPHLY